MKTFCILLLVLAVQVAHAIECVPYARSRSGIQIFGNADTWWSQAKTKGSKPYVGSVMSMPKQGATALASYGHVAFVASVISSTEIIVDHANWDAPQGSIFTGVKVRDISGNWTRIQIENTPGSGYGSTTYIIDGFVYPLGMTASNPSCNISSWKCSIRSPKQSFIGWFPPVDDCQQASQWFNLATVNGEKIAVGSTTKSACPQVCYAN